MPSLKQFKETIHAAIREGDWLLVEAADNSSDWSWFLIWPFEIQEEISQLSGNAIVTYQALHRRLGTKPSVRAVKVEAQSNLLAPGLFDLDGTRRVERPKLNLPLPPAVPLSLPDKLKVEWSELEVNPQGLEEFSQYYSLEGGWITLEDEWLHLKGHFTAKELTAFLKRLASRLIEPAALRIEDSEARSIIELRLKPKGLFLASGQRVELK